MFRNAYFKKFSAIFFLNPSQYIVKIFLIFFLNPDITLFSRSQVLELFQFETDV